MRSFAVLRRALVGSALGFSEQIDSANFVVVQEQVCVQIRAGSAQLHQIGHPLADYPKQLHRSLKPFDRVHRHRLETACVFQGLHRQVLTYRERFDAIARSYHENGLRTCFATACAFSYPRVQNAHRLTLRRGGLFRMNKYTALPFFGQRPGSNLPVSAYRAVGNLKLH